MNKLSDAKEYWDNRAKNIINDNEVIEASGNKFVLCEELSVSNKIILDMGCGYGRNTIPLSINNKVIGIDTSKNLLLRLKKYNEDIPVIQASLTHLPFKNNTFDIIFSFGAFYYIPKSNWNKAYNDFKYVLKPEGICYIEYIKLTKDRFLERISEILVSMNLKKRTWIKTYYFPIFLIKTNRYLKYISYNDIISRYRIKFIK